MAPDHAPGRDPTGRLRAVGALVPPTHTSGWLAIGTVFHGGGRSTLVIWHSRDATAWTVDYRSPPAAPMTIAAARGRETGS